MSTSIVRHFDAGWTLIVDLAPETRTLRLIRGLSGNVAVHEYQLQPADAARLDLGRYEPGLYFDAEDRPVVILHAADEALIWPCHRDETLWTGGQP